VGGASFIVIVMNRERCRRLEQLLKSARKDPMSKRMTRKWMAEKVFRYFDQRWNRHPVCLPEVLEGTPGRKVSKSVIDVLGVSSIEPLTQTATTVRH
jgi:hypothetical protein